MRTRLLAAVATLVLLSVPTLADDWLQWAGPNGDFTVDVAGLAEKWPTDGPRQLWKRPLGEGYSAILYKGGTLFTMYRDGDDEIVVALDAKTGKTSWEHRYARTALWDDMRPQFGLGPNATPAIADGRIVSIGIVGQVRGLDLASGKLAWQRDLYTDYKRRQREEEYGYSNNPLVYKGNFIVLVGGENVAVVGMNPADGSVVWESEPGGISYAPATLTRIGGRDQFVYFSPDGVVALDPSTGQTLWRSAIQYNNGNHLTPMVKCDDSHVWVGSQFDTGGGRLLKITRRGDAWQAEQLWYTQKLQASHWPLIRLGNFVYGSIGGNRVSFLTAFRWKTGEIAWQERGFHKAQSLYADGKLLFLDENGKLILAKVSPKGLDVLATAPVTERVSWTLPSLVGTTLYVRDTKNVLALDLSK